MSLPPAPVQDSPGDDTIMYLGESIRVCRRAVG